jgi:hypothetical protein
MYYPVSAREPLTVSNAVALNAVVGDLLRDGHPVAGLQMLVFGGMRSALAEPELSSRSS